MASVVIIMITSKLWFELWLGQTKEYKIGICCFSVKTG